MLSGVTIGGVLALARWLSMLLCCVPPRVPKARGADADFKRVRALLTAG